MEEDVHEYHGESIEVSYDVNRCIHVRECVEGLPGVFDPERRPWIDPDEADVDELAAVIERCPTGALHYERTDGDAPETEPVPERTTVSAVADGPLYLHGDVEIRSPTGGALLEDTRVALCRCGRSENEPLCDGSHTRVFNAEGVTEEAAVAAGNDRNDRTAEGHADEPEKADDERSANGDNGLTATLAPNGPVLLDGSFDLRSGNEESTARAGGALCRCGASANKPFCDGTHAEIGFSTDGEE